jgi:hypothetical protein
VTVRANLLGLLVNQHLGVRDRLRVVQTLEILGTLSPFSTPKFQGDVDSECTDLRRWVNSGPIWGGDYPGESVKEYYGWVSECPFVRELGNLDFWADKPIWSAVPKP